MEIFGIENRPRWWKDWEALAVAYAGFWKGGGGQELLKIWEEQRSELEIVPPKISLSFCSKLAEEQKKRSSLKFSPNICRKLGAGLKQTYKTHPFCDQSLCLTYKKGGPCHNFAYYSMLIILSWRHTRGQARSQDLKKGGGLFWKSEKTANDLDRNFHCSWIRITRFIRKLRRNFSENSEIQTLFQPKTRWSPPPPKKKGLHQNWGGFFGQNRKFRRFFSPKTSDLQNKKKKVFTEIEPDFSAKIGKSNAISGRIMTSTSQLRHPVFFGGGCFHFFTKNRLQKHQKRAILHTLQANGGVWAPPPPWLRYCRGAMAQCPL